MLHQLRGKPLQNTSDSQVFQFEEVFADLLAKHQGESASPLELEAGKHEQDLLLSLAGAGEAAYCWDIASDTISWSANTPEILSCNIESIKTGRLYASLQDSENLTSRYETVMDSKARGHNQGSTFKIEYAFRPEGRINETTIRLEDNGSWRAGDDGAPKIVFGTIRRIAESNHQEQHLELLVTNDPLTGMMNRSGLMDALTKAIDNCHRTEAKSAFAIAEINNLDRVKDTYGFDVADEVIHNIGRSLQQILRGSDKIAIYATGKFAIILNECDQSDLQPALTRFAEKIRTSLIETARGPVWTTISFGAVVLTQNAETAALVTARAEEALYDANRSPSEGLVIYQHSERREIEREFNSRCATELVKCLKEDTFRLAFQPIVDAKSRLPVMHEALLRMPDGQDFLGATHLIPLAERLGLVRQIDHAVLVHVAQALHDNPELRLTMNLSATTVADPFWHDQLIDVVSSQSSAAQRLTIEIGEIAALTNLKPARRLMERLREAGSSVAIEHFGQGYASIRHLRDMPVDMLKLDGKLCRNLTSQSDNEYLVKCLLELTAKSGIKTVAEWVETSDDADVLTLYGADYLQGHYFGLPSLEHQWISHSAAVQAITTEDKINDAAPAIAELGKSEPSASVDDISVPAFSEAPLDFSAIDDSIARLRDALSDLNAVHKSDNSSANAA